MTTADELLSRLDAAGAPMSAADTLLEQLDAAPGDNARAVLLAGSSPDLLAELNATLAYRKFVADIAERCAAEEAAFAAFTAELDGASDDAARVQLIEAARSDPQRGAAWLAEWHWQRTASVEDWSRRYVEMLDRPGAS
jgi:hypothetical protein